MSGVAVSQPSVSLWERYGLWKGERDKSRTRIAVDVFRPSRTPVYSPNDPRCPDLVTAAKASTRLCIEARLDRPSM